ncbi:hypothetical protein EG329_005012 [Mollisiaceae sp. DMI_Dod_QoI]|nr:hypothetical protein EG329_005012 [Helotiales sp. DMI_Dod_QoI]
MRNKSRKNQSETARRKKRTVIKKVHEYGKLPGVHVALFVYHNGRYTTYRSIDKRNWPPLMKEIQQSYPLPTNLLPRDVDTELQMRRSNKNHRTTSSQAKSGQSEHEGVVQMDMEHEG